MYFRIFIMALVWFAANAFIYFTAVHFLEIRGKRTRKLLRILTVVLTLSILASTYFLKNLRSDASALYYAASALWTGASVHLIIAATVCWLIALFARILGRRIPGRAVAAIVFGAAVIYSASGVWSAFNPEIKEIEVTIPRLPEAWKTKTVVQITDLHLGTIHTPERLARTIERINGLSPDVVFVTGDLFDGMSTLDMEPFVVPLRTLKAKDAVFFINGNHEHYIGESDVARVIAKTGFIHLDDRAVLLDGMQIIGVDYPSYGAYRDVKMELVNKGRYVYGFPTILLYHTPTNIEQGMDADENHTRTYWAPDVDYTAAMLLGVNLQLSGHTHCGQLLPFRLLTDHLYKGFDKGLHTEGNFSIYTSCGTNTFGPPMRTGSDGEITVIRLKPAGKG